MRSGAAALVDLINADGSASRFEELLQRCPNPSEAVGAMGLTPLHHAVFKDRADCAELLLARRADVNAPDFCGYTPVHLAAKHGAADVLALLLRPGTGAQPGRQDAVGMTPLSHATQEGHGACAQALLRRGADPNFCHRHVGHEVHRVAQDAPDCLAALLDHGADPEARTPRGLTVLQAAVEAGNLAFVELLLRSGCDVNARTAPRCRDRPRRTALELAVIGNEAEIGARLLAGGADPNCRDQRGNTPLHHASAHRGEDVIRLLLGGGADIHARNERGYQPLHRACAAGREPAILAQLIQSGANAGALNDSLETPLHCLLSHYIYTAELEEPDSLAPVDEECRLRVRAILNNGGRFSISVDDAKDELSVLRTLPLLAAFPRTVQLLESAAERVRVHTGDLILALVPDSLKPRLLHASRNPPSLRCSVRRLVRSLVGFGHMEESVRRLPLPVLIQNYLLFEWG